MSDEPTGPSAQFFRIGLRDPFIRGIGGLVFIATAVSIAIGTLGDGKKTIIAVALALIFGVLLVVFRVLIKNVDNTIVKWSCITSSTMLTGIFLIFAILSIPTVTFCWPPLYAQFLGITYCSSASNSGRVADYANLTDQRGSPIAMYPTSVFATREQKPDRAEYSSRKDAKYARMVVRTFPNDSGNIALRDEFDMLRKINAKFYSYCILREKMFVVSYTYEDKGFSLVRYEIGRNKDDLITLIDIHYDVNFGREFEHFIEALARDFVVDSKRTNVIQNRCDHRAG